MTDRRVAAATKVAVRCRVCVCVCVCVCASSKCVVCGDGSRAFTLIALAVQQQCFEVDGATRHFILCADSVFVSLPLVVGWCGRLSV